MEEALLQTAEPADCLLRCVVGVEPRCSSKESVFVFVLLSARNEGRGSTKRGTKEGTHWPQNALWHVRMNLFLLISEMYKFDLIEPH